MEGKWIDRELLFGRSGDVKVYVRLGWVGMGLSNVVAMSCLVRPSSHIPHIWVGFEECRTTRTFGIDLIGPVGFFWSKQCSGYPSGQMGGEYGSSCRFS